MDVEQQPMTKQLKMFEQWEVRPYQTTLFDKINQFDMRTIDLIYDTKGHVGKRSVLEYMELSSHNCVYECDASSA